MLTVISPAKRLDLKPAEMKAPPSLPDFQADAISLSRTAGWLSVAGLRSLMKISEDLAKQSQNRFRTFEETPTDEATKPAALAFSGDTYLGLEAGTLEADEMAYAQDHLRILSGLYGLLRPMDLIQPYRLEMGSRLATRRGKSLYQYWGTTLADAVNKTAEKTGAQALVNCASVEYFTALPEEALAIPVVTPVFKEVKNGEARILSFFAKRARGAMARFIVQNRIVDPKGLQDFDVGGYRFTPDQSTTQKPVFLRDQEAT